VDKMHFRVLRMKWPAVHAATRRPAQHQRRRRSPAVMRLGHHIDDLVEGAADEVHELELGHRTHARKRRAKRRAHNGRLGNRRIDHALWAKLVDKAISHLERAAIHANVFTNAEDRGVGLHLFPESLPDCFEVSCLGHCFSKSRTLSAFCEGEGSLSSPSLLGYLFLLLIPEKSSRG